MSVAERPGPRDRPLPLPGAAGRVEAVDGPALGALLQASDVPLVLTFGASWCVPCRMVAPVLDELAAMYTGRVRMLRVDTDEKPRIAADWGVTEIPTLLVVTDGERVSAVVGARPKAELVALLDAALP